MEGLKKMGEKRLFKYPFTHSGTGTSKCGTSTTLLLPCFLALVPIAILVVQVPPYKNFPIILYILDFTVCSLLTLLQTPSKLTCAC